MSESTTASEAISEALRRHHIAGTRIGTGLMVRSCSCGARNIDDRDHYAEVVVAVVRSLSPEQLAELIGGEVGYWTMYGPERPYMQISQQGEYTPARIAAQHVEDGTLVQRRVVGPWLPVIPVTHQGEETT